MIDKSDMLYLPTPGGYTGISSAVEAGYSFAKGKEIISSEEVADVPLYGVAKCGPEGLLSDEHLKDRIALSTRHFGITPGSFLVEAKGDSMEPMIKDGDLVLAQKSEIIESNQVNVVLCGKDEKYPKIKK